MSGCDIQRTLRPKPIHLAALINDAGSVSALCFSRPRAIILSQATWTLRDEAVTCRKCLKLIEQRKGAGGAG